MNKQLLKYMWLIAITIFVALSGCEEEKVNPDPNDGNKDPERNEGYLAFVVNSGNFGKANGSISFYEEDSTRITNFAVKKANGGGALDELGASVESMYIHDSIGYIICASTDKIERININTLQYIGAANDDFVTPRYMVAKGNKGYVTCWGNWGPNSTLPDTYIAVVDLTTFEITTTFDTPDGAEGLYIKDDKLYVANSYTQYVSVYNISDNSLAKTIEVVGAPQHFVEDKNGKIWVSSGSYFGVYADYGLTPINPATLEKGTFVSVPGMGDDGEMAIDTAENVIYLLGTMPYPDPASKIMSFDAGTSTLASSPVVSGENFYGVAFNNTSGRLYVANSGGFTTTGKVLVYETDGTLYDEQDASIGTFHVVFKK